eukprot:2591942-Amphidinium_carterae.1
MDVQGVTQWQQLKKAASYCDCRQVRRVRPRLHLFGHIHESYGVFRCEALPDDCLKQKKKFVALL